MLAVWIVACLIATFLVVWFVHDVGGWVLFRRSAARRHRAARAAATSAALDDAAFDPDDLEARGRELWLAVNHAMVESNPALLEGHVTPALRERVERTLARERAQGTARRLILPEEKDLDVRVIGVVNREGTGDDRAVLAVEVPLRLVTITLATGEHRGQWIRHGEHLVLGRDGEGWVLADRLEWAEAADEFAERLVDEPAQDVDRLTDATLQELASLDAIEARLADLADADEPVPQQVLSLSALDGRYAPPVLEASVRTILRAWGYASFDAGADLAELCEDEAAVQSLLDDPPRLARTAQLESVEPTAIEHETLTVTVRFAARIPLLDVPVEEQPKEAGWRYHWSASWILALDDAPGRPWRLRRSGELERGGFA